MDGGYLTLITLAAAPFIGSFVGVLVIRLPVGMPVVLAHSRCAACGCKIAAYDLVPIFSWLFLKGRCRYCGAEIDPICLLAELGAVAVVLWAVAIVPSERLLLTCLFGWTLLALALIDGRHFLLPNVLTLPLLAAGLIVNAILGEEALLTAVFGAAAGFLGFVAIGALYRQIRGWEGLGLGDAKFMAAIGAWAGWQALPFVLFLASLGGLLFALALRVSGRPIVRTAPLPFGVFLAIAGWIIWLYQPSIYIF